MKKGFALLVVLVVAFAFAACGGGGGANTARGTTGGSGASNSGATGGSTGSAGTTTAGDTGSTAPATGSGTTATVESARIGVVLSTGGRGDGAFNDAAYEGLVRAQQELGIEFSYVEPQSADDFLPFLRTMAESGNYDLIVSVGLLQTEALTEVSQAFPNQNFTHLDSNLDLPNVSGQQTRWQEQTFLAGVMAGFGTLSSEMPLSNEDYNTIGIILGLDLPDLRPGIVGFEAGARLVNPDVTVLVDFVGDFGNPDAGREVALSMFEQGADFILAIAGASSNGVFTAAREEGRYAFGAGAIVNSLEPDHIVATAHRSIGSMMFNDIRALVEGDWQGGFNISGLTQGSVSFETTGSNVQIPSQIATDLERARLMVVIGQLTPPATAAELGAWLAQNSLES